MVFHRKRKTLTIVKQESFPSKTNDHISNASRLIVLEQLFVKNMPFSKESLKYLPCVTSSKKNFEFLIDLDLRH